MSREQQECSGSLTATYNMNYTCRIDALINALARLTRLKKLIVRQL